jgi:hypothetical protein
MAKVLPVEHCDPVVAGDSVLADERGHGGVGVLRQRHVVDDASAGGTSSPPPGAEIFPSLAGVAAVRGSSRVPDPLQLLRASQAAVESSTREIRRQDGRR